MIKFCINRTILMAICLCSFFLNGQSKSDNLFKKENYFEVIQYLKEKEKKETLNLKEFETLALALYYNNNYADAYNYFKYIVDDKDFQSANKFYFAHCLKANNQDSLANSYLLDFYSLNKIEYVSKFKDLETLNKIGERFIIKNMTKYNSKFSDIFSSKYADNLYFSSTRNTSIDGEVFKWNNQPYLDLYIVNKDSIISKFNQINTDNHESDVSINKLNDDLYYTSSKPDASVFLKKQQIISTKIYKAIFNNHNYLKSISLPFNSEKYSCKNPFVDYVTKRLYFSSNMPGGNGGFDIYFTDVNNPVTVYNAGSDINTFGDEDNFYIDNDRNYYFASNAYVGYGGKDIFTKIYDKTSKKYKRVMNMGLPLNSKYDDFGFQFVDNSNKKGFFTSNRTPSTGDDDIYSFEITKELELDKILQKLQIKVLDLKTKTLISKANIDIMLDSKIIFNCATNDEGICNADVIGSTKYDIKVSAYSYKIKDVILETTDIKYDNVTLNIYLENAECVQILKGIITDKKTNLPIANANIIIETAEHKLISNVFADNNGKYELYAPCNSTLFLRINKNEAANPFYAEYQEYIQTKDKYRDIIEKNVALIPVGSRGLISNKDGQLLIPTKPIYFEYNKADVLKSSFSELDKVVQFLKENNSWTLNVNSYSDNRGSDEYNLLLSDKRAKATSDYIVSKGIDLSRVKALGFGETVQIIDCNLKECTDAEFAINRRSEFVISY